jgi:hypothetical protein
VPIRLDVTQLGLLEIQKEVTRRKILNDYSTQNLEAPFKVGDPATTICGKKIGEIIAITQLAHNSWRITIQWSRGGQQNTFIYAPKKGQEQC